MFGFFFDYLLILNLIKLNLSKPSMIDEKIKVEIKLYAKNGNAKR